MASKIFFDANVILDFFLERDANREAIDGLFKLIDDKTIDGYTTISLLQICAYILIPAKGLKATKNILEVILLKFNLLEGNKNTLLKAIKSDQKDIEDAIHYFIALENDMDAIVTSDKDFIRLSSPSLPVYSPEILFESLLKDN